MQRPGVPMATARQDYDRANRAAALRSIWANLTGKDNSLIPFEDLRKALGIRSQHYRGLRPVPLDRIIGSLDRGSDFDRVFHPTQTHSRMKWLSVDSAYLQGVTLPPVSLYKVGDAYFVVDGHHRVSVARQQGQAFIDAEVIEVSSRVPVDADLSLKDLDVLAAYRDFLEETRLDVLRPDQDIRLTMPGDYAKLIEHIRTHKYFVEIEESVELTCEEAIAHWYDHVYLPAVESIRRYNLLDDFPELTEADLYLWLVERAYYVSQELGQPLASWEVARDFADRFSRVPRRLFTRLRRRLYKLIVPNELEPGPPAGTWREERVEPSEAPHMFRDILVTVTGAETGWRALSQAAEIALHEDSVLHGLHVASPGDAEALAYGRRVLEEFSSRCADLGVPSTTSLVEGDVAHQTVRRARWVDLVAINQRREHGQWAEQPLGTIFQTVAAQAARPILAVPGTQIMPLERVLLAYDGGPKAREALFVLRHLVACWHVQATILTVESSRNDREALDLAREYNDEAGTNGPSVRLERGSPHEIILKVMGEEQSDLLLMGGYGHRPLAKAFLGSTVDRVLRTAWFPVLICR